MRTSAISIRRENEAAERSSNRCARGFGSSRAARPAFGGGARMSWQATSAVIEKSMQKGSARLMMLVLGNYADKFGFAWPGVKTVAGDTKQSERNIQYLIGKAVACGELEVFLNCGPVMPKARQRTNLFRLTFCEPPPPEHPYFGIKEWCKDCTTSNGSGGASQREKVVQESPPGGASQRQNVVQAVAPDPSGTVIQQSENGERARDKSRAPARSASNGHRKLKTPWPEDLELTPSMASYAEAQGIDAKAEFEAWRNYCLANDRRYADWTAAWPDWLKKAPRFGKNGNEATPRLSPRRQQLFEGIQRYRAKEASNGAGDANPCQAGAGEQLKRKGSRSSRVREWQTPEQRAAALAPIREIIEKLSDGNGAVTAKARRIS